MAYYFIQRSYELVLSLPSVSPSCLSNSRRHSANADVIADVKSKIIVSRRHFFDEVIFSATSKVQNYQNKTGEKSLNPNKYVLTTYFKEFFQRYFQIYMIYSLSLANCKHVRTRNRLYRSSLSAMFCFNRYQIQSVQSRFDIMTQPLFRDIIAVYNSMSKMRIQVTVSMLLSVGAYGI